MGWNGYKSLKKVCDPVAFSQTIKHIIRSESSTINVFVWKIYGIYRNRNTKRAYWRICRNKWAPQVRIFARACDALGLNSREIESLVRVYIPDNKEWQQRLIDATKNREG